MSKKLIKINVCIDCLSPNIVDPDCRCVYENFYKHIELEFEECECCGNVADSYADTEFNSEQLEKLNNDEL